MATENSTTPSSVSCKIREVNATDPELRFPEGDGFRALPPLVPLAQMIRRIHRLRRLFPAGLRRSDERWQAKTAVEFTL